MILSIYDNTQILSIGTDLPGIRFGIFAGVAEEPGGGCNYRVSFCGGFGILDLKTAWEAIEPSTMFCVGNDQEFQRW
ncbi:MULTISPECIES: hypothetical protein [unclassified Microcoleus]|uniref:hypothetical protein n=1 Tax=unclassified Microcoleus TaxID=2642155 RepID=UPI002FCE6BED